MKNEINPSYLLAIESSGKLCSVALMKNGEIIAEYTASGGNLHDRLLAEYVRRILLDNRIEIVDIASVAVSAGPGSFTGLRIGASLAKGLCFDNAPKLIAVPTLSALACEAIQIAKLASLNKIAAIILSHKDLVYYQCFDIELRPLAEISHLPIGEIKLEGDTFLCGNSDLQHTFSHEKHQFATASSIARLGHEMMLRGDFTPAEEFAPLYAQDFIPKKSKKLLNI